jgi:hypothetical protein
MSIPETAGWLLAIIMAAIMFGMVGWGRRLWRVGAYAREPNARRSVMRAGEIDINGDMWGVVADVVNGALRAVKARFLWLHDGGRFNGRAGETLRACIVYRGDFWWMIRKRGEMYRCRVGTLRY